MTDVHNLCHSESDEGILAKKKIIEEEKKRNRKETESATDSRFIRQLSCSLCEQE